MATKQINRGEWPHFFESFTRTHAGKPATAQVIGQGVVGEAEMPHNLPFESFQYTGDSSASVQIHLGGREADALPHEMQEIVQVWHRTPDGGDDEMVEIHGGDDHRLILKFA